jgi:putative metallohydrolase (TIGR04338 family)
MDASAESQADLSGDEVEPCRSERARAGYPGEQRATSVSDERDGGTELTRLTGRRPRDTQRTRLYLAETPLPSSPLPGLDACARFVDRVVGSMWWHVRFPERDLAMVPRLRPGNGARQAFYREEETGPTITLPRRYRTKGVVLHELVHFALGLDSGLPHHGRTFARVLLDATLEFCGPDRAAVLAESYRTHGVHIGRPPRRGPDGLLRYGCDERLRLARGRMLSVRYTTPGDEWKSITARFEGYERGASRLRLTGLDGDVMHVAAASVWDVSDA